MSQLMMMAAVRDTYVEVLACCDDPRQAITRTIAMYHLAMPSLSEAAVAESVCQLLEEATACRL